MSRLGRGGEASEIDNVLKTCRAAFIGIGLFSCVVNILYLSGSLYMMEIYDRVLLSRSVPTLVGITVIVAVLYLFQAGFDLIRTRLLTRIGVTLDQALAPRILDAVTRLQLKAPQKLNATQPLRDLDTIRGFLGGSGPTVFFDLPWLPFYIAICFAFHFWLGVTALAGTILLVSLTVLTELLTRRPMREVALHSATRSRLAETSRRNAEMLSAMGMVARLHARWHLANRSYSKGQQSASDIATGLGTASKMLRMMLQSGILAVGAYLVINQQATAGLIIAGSILSARALAPVDLAIANWKGMVAARQAKQRLDTLLASLPRQTEPVSLPVPSQVLSVEGVSAMPPEHEATVLQDVRFRLEAGTGLGVIGPSASGKSSLARLLVGIWTPVRGTVRLDGATFDQWSPAALGRHIGYLPQDVELVEGTVAENIARFDPDATDEAIIAAARAARVHDLVTGLPQGYATPIGEQGARLSAGQKQRIALARALYGEPFLVVLDEPNSNLDAEGDEALAQAILGVRQRGGIVVVVAHRPSALAEVNMVLSLAGGRMQAFGPKDEVLAKVLRPTAAHGTGLPAPFKVVTMPAGQSA